MVVYLGVSLAPFPFWTTGGRALGRAKNYRTRGQRFAAISPSVFRQRFRLRLWLISVGALALGAGGCSGVAERQVPELGECQTETVLDYESFGAEFLMQYCVDCHAAGLTSTARKGAPSEHNFDSLAGVRATEPGHLNDSVAFDADGVTLMPPPGYHSPSAKERAQFLEWLACGLP